MLGVLNRDQLRRSLLSARSLPQGRGTRRGRGARSRCGGQAGQSRHLLHRRRRHCRIPGAAPRQHGQATSSTSTGAKVGEHAGSHRFTVGQRRGLRLGTPAADGEPRFVLSITPTTNTITVGPRDALAIKIIDAIKPTWTGRPVDAEVVRSGTDSGPWPAHGRDGCRCRTSILRFGWTLQSPASRPVRQWCSTQARALSEARPSRPPRRDR